MFRLIRTAGWTLLLTCLASSALALTDPTRPGQYQPGPAKIQYRLESILFSQSRRVAVINGKVLAEGEKIGSARVLSIGEDTVRLQTGGKTLKLTLQRPSIRQEK